MRLDGGGGGGGYVCCLLGVVDAVCVGNLGWVRMEEVEGRRE
jgi:hypothetical protein